MIGLQIGSIVKSKAGHDANSFYVITGIEDGFVYIADGKSRKLDKPKRKNAKHVSVTRVVLNLSEIKTDKSLRGRLREQNDNNDKAGLQDEGGNAYV